MNKIYIKLLKAFEECRVKMPTQEYKSGVVTPKKAGRPPKPNMKRYTFKLDIVLHKRLQAMAKEKHTTKSAIVAQGLELFLNGGKYSTKPYRGQNGTKVKRVT